MKPHVADITCMDPNRPPLLAEKVFKTVRLLGYLIQNGVSKSKVMKRGKSIGKALNDAVARHHHAFTCRPRDAHVSFLSPLEYQFSCSGSPPPVSHSCRRKLSPAHLTVRMCRGGDGIIERPRVKITASAAFMLNDDDDDVSDKDFHVDEAADEFIARFYRELRVQRWLDHYC